MWGRTLVFLEALLHFSSVVSLHSLFEGKWREEKKKETLQIETGGLEASLESKGEKKPPLVALPWGKNERECGEIKVFVEM